MWILEITRGEFLDILAGRGDSILLKGHQSESLPDSPPVGDKMFYIWESKPLKGHDLPRLILIEKEKIKDFMAWATTFLGDYHPFTAYLRVIEWDHIDDLNLMKTNPFLGDLEDICSALIISEALSQYPKRTSIEFLTPLACASTYSYCISRALALGSMIGGLDRITERWLLARKLTRQPQRKLKVNSIQRVWRIVFNLYSQKKQINIPILEPVNDASYEMVHALTEYSELGGIRRQTWARFVKHPDELLSLEENMQGPIEKRVLAFNDFISGPFFSYINDSFFQSFMCGYLANRIGPGSLDHVHIIWPYLEMCPEALLWYGIFAGITPKNEIQSSCKGLGRRLIRDLYAQEQLLNMPLSDISVDELAILFCNEKYEIDFLRGISSLLIVEISPGVSVFLKISEGGKVQEDKSGDKVAKEVSSDDTLVELGNTIRKLGGLYKILSGKPLKPKSTTQKKSKQKNKKASLAGEQLKLTP